MTLDSLNMLFYTVAFIVPGFIIHITISAFVPIKQEDSKLSFLRFLSYSCFNYGLWSWLVYLIFKIEYFKTNIYLTAFFWALIIFIGPIIIGILWVFLIENEKLQSLFGKFGLSLINIKPTAWDYKSLKTCVGTWTLVTLKNGSQVAGRFGENSAFSSDPNDRDLYIEEMWNIADDDNWQPVENSDGILIRGSEISYIEFWKGE